MAFFGKRDSESRKANQLQDSPKDAKLLEELSELSVDEDRRELDRADSEVLEAVSEATRADIRELKLLEYGRCPECRSRTDRFLYTVVCPSCGWHRREVPTTGQTAVHLDNGDVVECDRAYQGDDEYLCVKDGVVVAQVLRRFIRRVEYIWGEEELEKARSEARKHRYGVCSWCEHDLSDIEEGEGPYEDFVAFGSSQERFVFCSERCMAAFRKRYPSRIHRNCYETDCSSCDLCMKRYDVDGFRRHLL